MSANGSDQFPLLLLPQMRCCFAFWLQCGSQVGAHRVCEKLDNRHHDRVTELAIGLRIGHRYVPPPIATVEAHKPCTFQRRETARAIARLGDKDFRSVLVISCRKSSRDNTAYTCHGSRNPFAGCNRCSKSRVDGRGLMFSGPSRNELF